jgi:hypothetical protein
MVRHQERVKDLIATSTTPLRCALGRQLQPVPLDLLAGRVLDLDRHLVAAAVPAYLAHRPQLQTRIAGLSTRDPPGGPDGTRTRVGSDHGSPVRGSPPSLPTRVSLRATGLGIPVIRSEEKPRSGPKDSFASLM